MRFCQRLHVDWGWMLTTPLKSRLFSFTTLLHCCGFYSIRAFNIRFCWQIFCEFFLWILSELCECSDMAVNDFISRPDDCSTQLMRGSLAKGVYGIKKWTFKLHVVWNCAELNIKQRESKTCTQSGQLLSSSSECNQLDSTWFSSTSCCVWCLGFDLEVNSIL